jgi:hypothetical protein
LRNDADAWETVAEGYSFERDELEAGQVYINHVRRMREQHGPIKLMLVEERFEAPEIHEKAWGDIDVTLLFDHHGQPACRIDDYKHGKGKPVDARWNLQTCGYGGMAALRYPEVQRFFLGIVQPRLAGAPPIQTFEVDREPLLDFVHKTLAPAMHKATSLTFEEAKQHLVPGEHCRFCPVKRAMACPALNQLPAVIEQTAPLLSRMSSERLGELYGKLPALEMMAKQIKDEVRRRRLDLGEDIANSKIVLARAFRAWKDGAADVLADTFGADEVLKTTPLSPNEIEEKFGKQGKTIAKAWAYTPDNGFDVAPLSDRRRAVTPPALTADKFDKFLDKPEL